MPPGGIPPAGIPPAGAAAPAFPKSTPDAAATGEVPWPLPPWTLGVCESLEPEHPTSTLRTHPSTKPRTAYDIRGPV